MSGERPVTLTMTERELHAVCNAADAWAWLSKQRGERLDSVEVVRAVTEKMRVAWVEQVTAPAFHRTRPSEGESDS